MMSRIWPSLLIAATLVFLSVNFLHPGEFTELFIPPLCTAVALWLTRVVYLWQRAASFARREVRRKKDPVEALDVPEGTKKVEGFGDHLATFHSTQWHFLHKAVDAQGRYFANGVVAAILPPLAL